MPTGGQGFFNNMRTTFHPTLLENMKFMFLAICLLSTCFCYAKSIDVTLTEGGTLSQFIPEEDYSSITELKISGPFSSEDIATIKELKNLETLDLQNIKLVKGKNYYNNYYDGITGIWKNHYYLYTIEKGQSQKMDRGKEGIGYGSEHGTKYYHVDYYCDDLRYAFANSPVRNLYWPKSVTTIGINAFDKSQIQTLHISAEVDSISTLSFKNAEKLENVYIDANNAKYKDIEGDVYTKDDEKLVFQCLQTGLIIKKTKDLRSMFISTLYAQQAVYH